MIKDTQDKKKRAYRAFVGLVFSLILIFGLFLTFPVKTAQGANNYIDDIVFYKNTTDGYNHIRFYVKTTFSVAGNYRLGYIYRPNNTVLDAFYFCPNGATYTAGNIYDRAINRSSAEGGCQVVTYSANILTTEYYIIFNNAYATTPSWTDAEKYYFSEFPSLTITYPQNNYEIAESFDIQGSYTLPAGSGYNLLMAGFFKAGNYDINWNKAVNVFTISVSEPSGSFDNLRVSNYVPKDIYDIYFRFYGAGVSYELPFHISNINIVSDLPYELPITGETPLVIPSFTTPSAQKIYEDYSNYDTPTPLFNIITGAIEPISQTIGDNLTFFSSRFNITNAKEAGEKAGDAVLIIRANAGIINSFFNDLPIAEILFLYLSALVVVIVFRIIRLLLKLIPFT